MSDAARVRGGTRVLVGVATVVLVAAACSLASAPPGPGTSAVGSLLPATPTELPEFDAARFHQLLAELRGKPVVVNIWASWCGPCIVEAPGLARLGHEYQGRVQFIGVNVLDQRAAAQAFIRKYGWTYPSVFDPSGAIRNDLGFVGQPATLVFDSAGARTFAASGAVDESQLRKELNAVV